MTDKEITIYHSPDADDAFMFYALTKEKVKIPGYRFIHHLCDIESLNHRALKGELECTAVSVHSYPYLDGKYAILDCGASMGERSYGPKLISREEISLSPEKKYRIAAPGKYTSTTLALQLFLLDAGLTATIEHLHFEAIQEAVRSGEFDLGAIIHEGQVTYEREGFAVALDLGTWWWSKHQLPLPLGVNVVRKDIGTEAMEVLAKAIRESIEYALSHRSEALEYALSFGRGLGEKDADTFVGMYVNDRTVSLGEEGRRSIELFLKLGNEHGLTPPAGKIEFIRTV